jgi:hypothetical protein
LTLIAKARSGSQDLRRLGTKVLSENSVKYWIALGGLRKIRELFTEFESEGFLFHTTWQWEVGTWLERASSVWDMLTLEMLDWEVPSTIYAKERKGTHEAWRFFE